MDQWRTIWEIVELYQEYISTTNHNQDMMQRVYYQASLWFGIRQTIPKTTSQPRRKKRKYNDECDISEESDETTSQPPRKKKEILTEDVRTDSNGATGLEYDW
eukprot:976644_1